MSNSWLTLLLAVACFISPTAIQAQEKRPLVCGTDLEGGIPYLFGDKNDPAGFEVDLMDALARELGRPIRRQHAAFDSLLPTLQRGDVDLAMNGLEITPTNLKQADFTRPYYIYRLQLIARIDDERFVSLNDCKEKKLTVGTLSGSSAARLLEKEEISRKLYDDQEGPFKDLVQKQIDAVLFDMPIALYYVVPDNQITHRKKDYPGLKLVGEPFAEGFYGIAVKKGNGALTKEMDQALGRVIRSGELKRILTKWHLWSPDQYRLYTPLRVDENAALSLGFAQYFLLLLQGAGVTILITFAGMALAVSIGLPIATSRLYGPWPLRWLAIGYVEFFRGIPVLLLLYFLYFGLPELIDLKLNPLTAAILGFGLNYAAYEAEIYRGGIQSIPVGQWEASASLGMSPLLTFRRIVFPQSIRVILPPMTNDFIALFKDTSVVSIISVIELSKQYQILTKTYGGFLQIGLTTAALYLVMSVPLGYLSRYLERRWGAK
ncbi:MAG: ABC transporter permease subunit [Planctomycetes bacterium]|nr:ABC transporter permease subunit [Planctomycetota bacterium]